MWRKRRFGKKIAAVAICSIIIVLFVFSIYHMRKDKKIVPAIEKGEPMLIWIASDIHFLSPDLTDKGPLFTRALENGDGKMAGDSAEGSGEYFDLSIKPITRAVFGIGEHKENAEEEKNRK